MKVGDLVRVPIDWSSPLFGAEGTVGVVIEIEPNSRWVLLHTGEKFSKSDLEVVVDEDR